MKILSFIVPAYNCERYLDECITSLIDETLRECVEIIVVSDGSTDATATIARKYCACYPDMVRLIEQENRGHGGALNTGCAVATGRYLKVIDADDRVDTCELAPFVSKLAQCEADVVLTHYHTRDITSGEVKKWMCYPQEFDRAYSITDVMAHWKDFERGFTLHGIAYRTDFYRGMGIALSEHVFYEDYEFATIPACFAKSVCVFDLFLYNYRIGDAQQSVSPENKCKRIENTKRVLARLAAQYREMDASAARDLLCMKTKELLLSYLTTVLLCLPDRKAGRRQAGEMMRKVRREMPETFSLSKKQYRVFDAMNRLHISYRTWSMLLHSRMYRIVRRAHGFD